MRKAINTTDMTVGNPMRHILRFALPLLVGNLFQQLYNMVDSLVVGNFVGGNALAAVGNCGSINGMFFSLAGGLATGIGILVAQYFGAHDEKGIRVVIGNALYVLLSVSIVASVLGIVLSPAIMRLLATPDSIFADSVMYMQITCAGMLAIIFYNGIAAILRALGDSKTPLYFLILASIINVVLDLLFVVEFSWGVMGVALATIISQLVSAVVSLIYAYVKVPYFRLNRDELRPNRMIIGRSFQLGFPIAVQSSMISVSCMVLQGVINSFGETVMAASNIITRLESVVHQPFSSLATALTTYAGQNIGAKKPERVKKGYRQTMLVGVIFGVAMIPIAFLFGESIIGAFVKEADVIAIGVVALRITSVFYAVVGTIHITRAVLNGCGDAAFALINGFAEVVCRVVYSTVLTGIPFIGYWGIWWTTVATWTTAAGVCIIRYASGIWKKKAVETEITGPQPAQAKLEKAQ